MGTFSLILIHGCIYLVRLFHGSGFEVNYQFYFSVKFLSIISLQIYFGGTSLQSTLLFLGTLRIILCLWFSLLLLRLSCWFNGDSLAVLCSFWQISKCSLICIQAWISFFICCIDIHWAFCLLSILQSVPCPPPPNITSAPCPSLFF